MSIFCGIVHWKFQKALYKKIWTLCRARHVVVFSTDLGCRSFWKSHKRGILRFYAQIGSFRLLLLSSFIVESAFMMQCPIVFYYHYCIIVWINRNFSQGYTFQTRTLSASRSSYFALLFYTFRFLIMMSPVDIFYYVSVNYPTAEVARLTIMTFLTPSLYLSPEIASFAMVKAIWDQLNSNM
jgi:hypothetical protein